MDKVAHIKQGDCRSPYGERGLKSFYRDMIQYMQQVALLTESVD